jgi:hypothetical protein
MTEQRVQQLRVELLSSLQQSWWSGDDVSFKQPCRGSSSKAGCGRSTSSNADSQREQLLEALLLAHVVSDIRLAAAEENASSGSSSSNTATPSPSAAAAAAVLSTLGQLVLNGIAIKPLLAGGGSSSGGSRQGLGLFPVAALFNHSCDPNCSIRWEWVLRMCVQDAVVMLISSRRLLCVKHRHACVMEDRPMQPTDCEVKRCCVHVFC